MVIQSRTSVLTMVMAMISVMAMIGPNVEAFGGFSLQSHGRKVGSLSLPSPSGLATTKKRLREEYLRMSSNDDGNQKEKPELNSDGTLYDDGGALYDDQVPQRKDPLSNSMRERLLKEASSGLDSEKKNPNVILYVSAAIAVLVVLGGQGILY